MIEANSIMSKNFTNSRTLLNLFSCFFITSFVSIVFIFLVIVSWFNDYQSVFDNGGFAFYNFYPDWLWLVDWLLHFNDCFF